MRLLSRTAATQRLDGFVLAGDTSAEAWIKTLLQDELPAQAYGRLLLLPGAKAPVAVAAARQAGLQLLQRDRAAPSKPSSPNPPRRHRHRRRCGCSSLQAALKCGTNCGSCVPELKRMVRGRARDSRRLKARQHTTAMSISHYIKEIGRGKDGARAADARAGGRPVRPGARRQRHRPARSAPSPGHAHQGRDRPRRWPAFLAATAARCIALPPTRAGGRAAQLQRRAQAAGADAAAGAAAGARRPAGAGARRRRPIRRGCPPPRSSATWGCRLHVTRPRSTAHGRGASRCSSPPRTAARPGPPARRAPGGRPAQLRRTAWSS